MAAELQVDCGEMPLDLRNMAQGAIKYKCLPGNPANFCFQCNPEEGEYDFQSVQAKVAQIVDSLPRAHMESFAEVVLDWECQGAHGCLELLETISKKQDFPLFYVV